MKWHLLYAVVRVQPIHTAWYNDHVDDHHRIQATQVTVGALWMADLLIYKTNTLNNTYTWFHKLNITPSSICETPNITDIFFLNELVYIILFSDNCHTCRIHTHNITLHGKWQRNINDIHWRRMIYFFKKSGTLK